MNASNVAILSYLSSPTKGIVQMSTNDLISSAKDLIEAAEQERPELKPVLTCLAMKQVKVPMQDIASELEVSRATLYRWVKEWERKGLIDAAREMILAPAMEDLLATRMMVLQKWPAMLEHLKNLVFRSHSDHTKLLIVMWLYDTFVKPALEDRPKKDWAAIEYAKRPGDFNPHKITLPKNLQKPNGSVAGAS